MDEEIDVLKSKILIVEGNHERDFFETWLKELNRNDVQVMPIGGKTLLKHNFKLLVRRPNFGDVESILITRDADDNHGTAFQSVCDVLQDNRVTDSLNSKGINLLIPESAWTFTQNTIPRICIAILPVKDQIGALEDLLLQTVNNDPMSEKSYLFIDDAIITLNETGYRNPPPFHRLGKAKIHAFLATFEYPDKDQGKSALAGVWDFQHGSLVPLRAILEEL